jgi:membrane protein YdbS with pleckstrin-like domain
MTALPDPQTSIKEKSKIMKTIKLTRTLIICSAILVITNLNAQKIQKEGARHDPQKNGYVPNKETAIRIAEAIWLSIYGKEIYKNKPFNATLKDNEVWIIEGTLHSPRGGVPYAEIQKADCKVLKVTYGK